MIDWLGIGHLFELSGGQVVLGFGTPLFVCAAVFVAHMILPARRVTGYVADRKTGEPRRYRLNGLAVFVLAHIVWWFELTGMPRDWFYRSTMYAVAGGLVIGIIATTVLVFTQPEGEQKNRFLAWWFGRAQELQYFNGRFDLKMYFYIVGGTMLSLNAWSGAVWHNDNVADANPGLFLYVAINSFYMFDYFVFERVQLYTYDLIHENVGFKLTWGGPFVWGWMFVLPLWGLAPVADPGFSNGWTYFWLIGSAALFFVGWVISRGANLQKYTFKRWPERKFLGIIEPEVIEAGDRKILCSGLWGAARHFNYFGEGLYAVSMGLVFGHFTNLWAWTYAIFIVSLFVPRQIEDDKRCAEKYGPEKWAEYKARVPYRIVPGIY
ncbi:DUF1295 domain-containing protein [Candidatus Poriferisodalis sp.]|uniref:DUF1295 domain-containing protein n=1 Tax=Candidatus Poriferisodalis sp. TaxID=3101277 RepID=UPI003B5A4881